MHSRSSLLANFDSSPTTWSIHNAYFPTREHWPSFLGPNLPWLRPQIGLAHHSELGGGLAGNAWYLVSQITFWGLPSSLSCLILLCPSANQIQGEQTMGVMDWGLSMTNNKNVQTAQLIRNQFLTAVPADNLTPADPESVLAWSWLFHINWSHLMLFDTSWSFWNWWFAQSLAACAIELFTNCA